MKISARKYLAVLGILVLLSACSYTMVKGPIPEDAVLVTLGKDFTFTEGPAVCPLGNIFFTDVQKNRIHKMVPGGAITVFREGLINPIGLACDPNWNLIICESGKGRVVSLPLKSPGDEPTIICDSYDGKRFNGPNDLALDSKGGIYFSDPNYSSMPNTQDGEHVYYVTPDRSKVIRVVDDMKKPNGLFIAPDGKTIFISDQAGAKTFKYTMNEDGTLSGKTLFTARGADGLKGDSMGNVYIADGSVYIYNAMGEEVGKIKTPVAPTNFCFYGPGEKQKLFITARSEVYSISTDVKGLIELAAK